MTLESNGNMAVARKRDLVEAADEIERELNVRARCFPRWIKDGRVSATDAQDRLDRLATALEYLRDVLLKQETPDSK
jgi:hypothetical protein